jgi:hypothetical protein
MVLASSIVGGMIGVNLNKWLWHNLSLCYNLVESLLREEY